MDGKIGAPSVHGITGALKNAGIGAVGGLLVSLSTAIFGTGLWGAIGGIALAGSVVKGVAGETIATVLGFQIGQSLLGGGSGASSTNTSIVV